ncbi:MAG: FecR domain-containing protein [Proteobacteria bacterium]|nr:FecR domain-containing protein [Pseudomonadota bacterium]
MTKQIFIYAVLAVVLTTGGVVASILIFGEEAAELLPTIGTNPERASITKIELPESITEPQDMRDADKTAADDLVKVLSVTGSARRSHGDGEQWNELSVGEALEDDDTVRTGDSSKVTLRVGQKSKLELAERAELGIGRVSPRDRRFKLLSGRISVDYKEKDSRRLRIENKDGSTAAETEEGIFVVLNTGATIAVATKTGVVDLFSAGQQVAVLPGQQSVAAGGAPSSPGPIPVDVMLRVIDPGCRIQRDGFIVLKGRTTPGAAVSANGNVAEMSPSGRFSVRVPLKVGKNSIVVTTEDISGNTKMKTLPCVTVDPNAPIKKINIRWRPSGGQEDS